MAQERVPIGLVVSIFVSGAVHLERGQYCVGEVEVLFPPDTTPLLSWSTFPFEDAVITAQCRMWYAAVMGVSPDKVVFLYRHMLFGKEQ